MSVELPEVVTSHKRAAIIGTVALAGYLYWTRGRHAGATTPPAVTSLNAAPGDGSTTGAASSAIPASGTVTNETPSITTNAQWATAAVDFLVSDGLNAGFAQTAISKALAGQELSPAEQAAVSLAIGALHSPPEGMPPIGKGPPGPPTPGTPPTHILNTGWWRVPSPTTWTALAQKFAIPGGAAELELYHVAHGGDPLLVRSPNVPAGHTVVYPRYVA